MDGSPNRITWESIVMAARKLDATAAVQRELAPEDVARLARLVLEFHAQLTGITRAESA